MTERGELVEKGREDRCFDDDGRMVCIDDGRLGEIEDDNDDDEEEEEEVEKDEDRRSLRRIGLPQTHRRGTARESHVDRETLLIGYL